METPLADRKNMVFMGTFVSYGNCRFVVRATGKDTELGRISGMIGEKEVKPPLKIQLEHLAKRQAYLVLIIIRGRLFPLFEERIPIMDTLITAIALAVAGVPEGSPLCCDIGPSLRNAGYGQKKCNNQEPACGGSLLVRIGYPQDKTGTLTTGEMTVREIYTYRPVEVMGYGYDPEGEFWQNGVTVNPKEDDIALLLKIGVLSTMQILSGRMANGA